MRSEQEINDACKECPEEYRKSHRCYKDEGKGGICLLACRIESMEYRERR